MVPVRVPFCSRISTIDFGFPVWSSMVFHRPAGEEAAPACARVTVGMSKAASKTSAGAATTMRG